MSDDMTVQILIEIRDEIRSTNQRVDQTRTELRDEIGLVRTTLEREIGLVRSELRRETASVRDDMRESELRLATRIVEQTAATRDLYTMLTGQLDLRDRIERCEQDIGELKHRIG